MAISQRDRIVLWTRAAGRCSFADCGRELTQDTEAADAAYTLGQMAHIVGEQEAAVRGHSTLTAAQRDTYSNLILLCPVHHRIIDEDPAAYPVERLHLIKDEHEAWVREALAGDERATAAREVYASLVDAAEVAFDFEDWDSWTYRAFEPIPQWDEARMEHIHEFRRRVLRAAWPGTHAELERAIQTLSIAAEGAANKFGEHCDRDERTPGSLRAVQWYRTGYDRDEDERRRIERAWNIWDADRSHLVKEMCRAANWFADCVRRDINPRFLALRGRFTLAYFDERAGITTQLFEYSVEDKGRLPAGFVRTGPPEERDDG